MGPSPLILHATMSGNKPNGDVTLKAIRVFRDLLCEHLGCYVDLYGVQMSPCMWRHWLRAIKRDETMHEQTKYRMMCQVLFRVETKTLLSMREWLLDIDALDLLDSKSVQVQRKFYVEFDRNSRTVKADVLKALEKLEASIQQAA